VFELLVAPKRRARIDIPVATGEGMARWAKGEQTVQFLVDRIASRALRPTISLR
jgi:hypothetical protein